MHSGLWSGLLKLANGVPQGSVLVNINSVPLVQNLFELFSCFFIPLICPELAPGPAGMAHCVPDEDPAELCGWFPKAQPSG